MQEMDFVSKAVRHISNSLFKIILQRLSVDKVIK